MSGYVDRQPLRTQQSGFFYGNLVFKMMMAEDGMCFFLRKTTWSSDVIMYFFFKFHSL